MYSKHVLPTTQYPTYYCITENEIPQLKLSFIIYISTLKTLHRVFTRSIHKKTATNHTNVEPWAHTKSPLYFHFQYTRNISIRIFRFIFSLNVFQFNFSLSCGRLILYNLIFIALICIKKVWFLISIFECMLITCSHW